ncbi:hypothetical protein G4W71_09070 [Clostridium botulinum]|uniref:hypothetical protein n=1 Tax=Clostridium botulinum TaxID=1491 RepID=UPI001788BD2B|nr:hypothetical protein [Clostridium botulinum]MBE1304169.1 hypothetical protein [Clostridium botulinum]
MNKIISYLNRYISYTKKCKKNFPNSWVGENNIILKTLENRILNKGITLNTNALKDELIECIKYAINKIENEDKKSIEEMNLFLWSCPNVSKFLIKFKLLED